MRVPLQWLADYVDLDLPTHDLATRMTMLGLKVESIERIGAGWHDVIIGQVTELEPHPTSNKPLNVATVDLGNRTITVVTGAQNVQQGDRVPVVLVGGLLPHGPDGEPMTIAAKPMAGITSEGMLASARELGLSDEHSGIHVLPPDAPLGEGLGRVMGGDVLDIETNPNRPDTLSMIGIAREVAAMTQQQVRLPDLDAPGNDIEWMDGDSIEVRVEAPDLCSRYTALRIEGIEDRESPVWLASRLEAAGMRPISLLVDITNYVMLEYGQPMHAFDARALEGGSIVVRRARAGEVMRTLDGVERALSSDNLVIADDRRAVGIAGVMGGENSEIGPDTTTIVLESATFDGASVRRTAQALSLRTEASSRFEKGLPPEQAVHAARRYLQLLARVLGRAVRVARMADAFAAEPDERSVRMPVRDLQRLSGLPLDREYAADALSSLGFGVEIDDAAVIAHVPYWRRADIFLSADLVEEVVRMAGYDTVPTTLPRTALAPPAPVPSLYWSGVVRERLLANGVSEAVTGTLTSEEGMLRARLDKNGGEPPWDDVVPHAAGVRARDARVEPIRLLNPPTQERDVLRLTLVPQLLDVVARNLKHTEERLAFFEIAHTYFPRPDDLPYERRTLALALSGRRSPRTWLEPDPGPYTFYDVKGLIETLLVSLHITEYRVEPGRWTYLHPGRSAVLRVDGQDVGVFGEVHPRVATTFDIDGFPVQVAELDLDSLFAAASDHRTFSPLPRYPAANRDVAVVVNRDLAADAILATVKNAGDALVESATIFDVYTGHPLPEDKKSVAIEMHLRAADATLTQDEIAGAMERITDALTRDLGAALRE
ncbi:MAG: phenylalanine--tRNA ligase subunit beta [Chloroflexota bacterium]